MKWEEENSVELFNKLRHQNPTCLVNDVVKSISEITGYSSDGVYCINNILEIGL